MVDRFRGATSLFEKGPTRRGQLDVSATYEQLDSELSLKGLDLLAKRWPGHPEALGGSPEVQLFGDGDEVAQLPELHTSLISLRLVRTRRCVSGRSQVPGELGEVRKTGPPGLVCAGPPCC